MKSQLTTNNNLFFKIHQAGFFNRFFSFQIGVGMSSVFKKPLIAYGVYNLDKNSCDSSTAFALYEPRRALVANHTTNFFDLIDYDKEQVPFIVDYPLIERFYDDEILVDENICYRYVVDQENEKLEQYFATDKKRLILEDNKNYHIRGFTLSNYSTFFFNRGLELDRAISKVKIKSQYQDLAKKIFEGIGDFNGIHVRLTDHVNQTVLEDQIDNAINYLGDKKVIVLTDDPNNEIFKNKNVLFFDDLLINYYRGDFSHLDIKTEVTFGLVGALFMTYANDFIGTYKSTFTSFIQREINQKKDHSFKFLHDFPDDSGKPFSWINNKDYGPVTRSISRDYKESRLMI